jgi:hypothetical protein
MTSYDSCLATMTCSLLISSMHVRVSSSSANRSRPSEGCKPRASSSASITSCTSRSASCMKRRIWHSFNVRLRLVSHLDLELKSRDWAETSC